ncbi:hypothetical protein SeLEV6574_g06380 [Synchytrium endobioticum]|uniref:Uncharacterized protein n=1 Tax=Synchytrium endobioticum TaxID=286115 RepID=A0A507CP01_9FUNG|nr:hypothetical protein SeLEV6574_g06380 [Synchytrium endobioticum]
MVTLEPRMSPAEMVDQLNGSSNPLLALRRIKNAIVGARNKKNLFLSLGILPRLVEFLSAAHYSTEIKTETAILLASFSNGNTLPVVDDEMLAALLHMLSSSDARSVDASTRALKSIFDSPSVSRDIVFKTNCIPHLVSHLSNVDLPEAHIHHLSIKTHIVQTVASVIARVATTTQAQVLLAHAGVIPKLVNLLDVACTLKTQEAAIDALGCLCRDNAMLAKDIVTCATSSGELPVAAALRLLRVKRPTTRLMAAACLTNFVKTDALPPQNQEDVILVVLPTLIDLFREPKPTVSLHISSSNGTSVPDTNSHNTLTTASSEWALVQERAPLIFASLVSESEKLQKAAMEGDAILKLGSVILGSDKKDVEPLSSSTKSKSSKRSGSRSAGVRRSSSGANIAAKDYISSGDRMCKSQHVDRVREAALVAVAAACSLMEECRRQVIDAKLLPAIVLYLRNPNVGIRAAACQCTHSLSRSVKTLRTSLVDAGIALPLLALLSDPSREVRLTASATLCNLVLDFSPMKTTLIENGGVERLVEMVWTTDVAIQLNAIWALKNLLYKADSSIKKRVMQGLTWDGLDRLVWHQEIGVQEQALNLMRNLASDRELDIDELFSGFGRDKLLLLMEAKLIPQNHDEILTQALTLLRNLAGGVGSERHKASIMSSDAILRSVLRLMVHPKRDIRGQAIWVVLNLTWRDDTGSVQRVAQLAMLGFDEALRNAMNDSDIEVRETAKKAMALFTSDASSVNNPTAENAAASSPFGSMIEHLGVDGAGRGW